MMARVTHRRFKVRGNTTFPTDMLRYDGCYPASERDSATIDAANRREDGPFIVELESKQESVVRYGPTEGRWQSFLWKIEN